MAADILNMNDAGLYWKNIRSAAEVLLSGGVVAFPTETVYGLGVCDNNDAALDRLYEVKQRSREKKLSILISEPEDVTKYVRHLPIVAEKLIRTFWPGPLTIIFVLDDSSTAGIRNPSNRVVRDLINAVRVPIASTSANISGRPPATDAQQVISSFYDKIDLVLDDGPVEEGIPSTIVKIAGDNLEIIRQGVIEKERLDRCLNEDCLGIRP